MAEQVPLVQAPPISPVANVEAVPDHVLNPTSRWMGRVAYYSKHKGYGFITLLQSGLVPEDKVFVHWRSIQSQDRFPFLVAELEVEFSIVKRKDAPGTGGSSLRAVRVCKSGGGNINLQDQIDAEKKTFVGGQDMRYTGTMKFFEARGGYGYINVDEGYPEEVPKELRVERSEINAGGQQPQKMQNLAVEFGVWKNSRGAAKAYNVTLPGGVPLTQEALENRQKVGSQIFSGQVKMWSWRQGWGFIKADGVVPLPPNVTAKLAQQNSAAAEKATAKGKTMTDEELLYFRRGDVNEDTQMKQDMKVQFELYIDDKGAGACNVSMLPDS